MPVDRQRFGRLEAFPIGGRGFPSLTDREIPMLNDLEDVVLVGFPDGQRADRTRLPLALPGRNAEPWAVPLNVNGERSIAAQVFGGSSGSPVFVIRRRPPEHWQAIGKEVLPSSMTLFVGLVVAGREVTRRIAVSDDEVTVDGTVRESLGVAQVIRQELLFETIAAFDGGLALSM
jgi:hypothetical protein